MYVVPQTGQAAADTAAPTCNAHYLGTLRRNILAAIINNPDFTAAEQLRCNDAVYQCQDSAKLALWLRNVRRVAAEREETRQLASFGQASERSNALVAQPERAATPAQCDELYQLACHPALTPADKTHTLALLPSLTEGAALACIGQLYAKVLRRTGQLGWRASSTLALA